MQISRNLSVVTHRNVFRKRVNIAIKCFHRNLRVGRSTRDALINLNSMHHTQEKFERVINPRWDLLFLGAPWRGQENKQEGNLCNRVKWSSLLRSHSSPRVRTSRLVTYLFLINEPTLIFRFLRRPREQMWEHRGCLLPNDSWQLRQNQAFRPPFKLLYTGIRDRIYLQA